MLLQIIEFSSYKARIYYCLIDTAIYYCSYTYRLPKSIRSINQYFLEEHFATIQVQVLLKCINSCFFACDQFEVTYLTCFRIIKSLMFWMQFPATSRQRRFSKLLKGVMLSILLECKYTCCSSINLDSGSILLILHLFTFTRNNLTCWYYYRDLVLVSYCVLIPNFTLQMNDFLENFIHLLLDTLTWGIIYSSTIFSCCLNNRVLLFKQQIKMDIKNIQFSSKQKYVKICKNE
ncbi:Hypothetical_protein [Hexamita inflata]|uniref:Hypothetical_protein n=1 Tax=Hexamita inflata TaxID=28002 RepID=A0ABP1HL51_9EUKA